MKKRSTLLTKATLFSAALLLLASNVAAVLPASLAAAATQPATVQFSQPCGNAGTPTATHHVIWILMENESYSSVIGSPNAPYQTGLASQCGVPTNMYNESHGSLVNYVSMTNGLPAQSSTAPNNSNFTAHNDCSPNSTFCFSTTPDSIFSQTEAAGQTWRDYAEDMPSNCFKANSGTTYAVRHNPATYYPTLASCAQYDIPMGDPVTQTGAFYTDVANGTLPNFTFISPNLIDDAHDSSTLTGDNWLKKLIPTITSGANYQSGDTTIFITNDEGGGSDPGITKIGEDCSDPSLAPSRPSCHIPTIVVSPYTPSGTQDATFYTHYSMLRTTEELLGLPLLNQAASANSMTTAFNLGPGGIVQPPTLTAPILSVSGTSQTTVSLSWTSSALATGYTVQRDGVAITNPPLTGTTFTDTGLNPGMTYTYTVVATDGVDPPATSNSVSPTTSPAGQQQWIANPSFETDMTGWTGVYNGSSQNSRVAGGFDGGFSLRSVNTASSAGSNGVIDKPHWIDGTTNKTVAGTVYTGSVQVKADAAGQKFVLLLRELTPSGAGVSSKTINATAADTAWFNINGTYKALNNGDAIGFYLYATNTAAGKGFNADAFSLTSPGAGDTTPPSAPSNPQVTIQSPTQVLLNWTASTDAVGVTSYSIARNDLQQPFTSPTNSFSDGSATPGASYTYTVTAFDAAHNQSSALTIPVTMPPALGTATWLAPHATSTEVDLSWTAATGATSYTILRDDGQTYDVPTGTSYADITNITPGATYSYQVVAHDNYEENTTSDPLQVIVPLVTAPQPPAAPVVTATVNSSTQITLNWTEQAGSAPINGYTIWRNDGAVSTNIGTTSLTTFPISGLTPSTTYTYTVTATDSNGLTSLPSTPVTARTQDPAPTTTQLIGNTDVEANMTGWGGKYGSSSFISITRDTTVGHNSSASIKVTALAGASNLNSGINDNPRWVTSTTAGTIYSQSAWVYATAVNQKISLRLREWNGSALVTDQLKTITATAPGWQQISQTLTAGGTGNQLSFAVYGNAMNAGQYFYIDDFSLTIPTGN